MGFSETYREERLINRRSRGRKARIAGRIIGFGLTACLIVAIRTDPELRAMVDDAALAVISTAMPQDQADQHTQALAELGLDPQSSDVDAAEFAGQASAVKAVGSQMPASKVKVHRGGIVKD